MGHWVQPRQTFSPVQWKISILLFVVIVCVASLLYYASTLPR